MGFSTKTATVAMTRANRISIQLVLLIVSVASVWIIFSRFAVYPLIERAYHGETLAIFNNIISGQADHPVGDYLANWDSLSLVVLFMLVTAGLVVLTITRPEFQRYVDTRRGEQAVLISSAFILVGVVLVSLSCYALFADQVIGCFRH